MAYAAVTECGGDCVLTTMQRYNLWALHTKHCETLSTGIAPPQHLVQQQGCAVAICTAHKAPITVSPSDSLGFTG